MRLTRENTAIVLDSTSDFVDARDRHANMRLVPLYVLFDGESLRDHVDICPEQFYERLAAAKTLPTTSQPTPADFLACYEELAAAGFERIWSLHLTSKLSGTYESRRVPPGSSAANGSGSSTRRRRRSPSPCSPRRSTGGSRPAPRTRRSRARRAVQGTNGVVFTVATLEYLQKGGRIGKAQALAGSLLNVKPILTVEDGVIVPLGRVRGRQKALEEFAKLFAAETEDREGLRIAIAHANAPEWVDVLTDMAAKVRPKATLELVEPLGAVVGTHAGPGCRRLLLVPGLRRRLGPRARPRPDPLVDSGRGVRSVTAHPARAGFAGVDPPARLPQARR